MLEKSILYKLKNFAKIIIVISVVMELAGCSVNPATGNKSFTGFMSLTDEIKIGRKEHPKILKEYGGLYKNHAITTYVNKIGNNLANKSELPNLNWHFNVLNSPQVNAFALPGGYVYITRGLMALASNEAEVAGVIAHEIGHITSRHAAQRYSNSMLAGGISMATNIFLGSAANEIADLATRATLKSYSRNQEFEADSLGVRYLSRGKYNTNAMASFLSKLRAHSQLEAMRNKKDRSSVDQRSMFSTHPRTIDRVQRAITNTRGPRLGSRIGTVDYMERIHKLLYGDDPKEGMIKGRSFVHPKLRFRFNVPLGYQLYNSPNAVIARGPAGSLIQFDLARKPFQGKITDYILNIWGQKSNFINVENINVNGMRGATAVVEILRKNRVFDLRLTAIRHDEQRIYRFIFLTPKSQTKILSLGLQKTTYSLKNISPIEASKVKPTRISVIPVLKGDSIYSFSRRMKVYNFKEETFRVLNGLAPSESVRLGQLVKIIVN